MRRMLDPTKVGVPSTIEFDKDGNRKVSKNLGVDGKLKLKSLVSNTNPDGDITKELGGGGTGDTIHGYSVILNGICYYIIYTSKNYNLPRGTRKLISDFLTNEQYKDLRPIGDYPASGTYKISTTSILIVNLVKITDIGFYVSGYDIVSKQETQSQISYPQIQVIQLY